MNPLDIDRLEFWQAAVMLGRDKRASIDSMVEELRRNEERARAERSRPKPERPLGSRPDRVIRAV